MQRKRGETIGSYKILDVLGEGAVGVVYLAHEEENPRSFIALKEMPIPHRDEEIIRLRTEFDATKSLDCTYIVRSIGDIIAKEGLCYLPIQYVKGFTLSSKIDNINYHDGLREERNIFDRKGLSVVFVLKTMIQVLKGLHSLHSQYAHRDLHGGNILIDEDSGIARISDFGCLRDIYGLTGPTPGTFKHVGAALISSYEQLRYPEKVEWSSDLYSVGVNIYRALTARYPYYVQNGNINDLMKLVQSGKYVPIDDLVFPEIPRAFSTIINRLLSNNPEERGSSALSVAEELYGILKSVSEDSTIPRPIIFDDEYLTDKGWLVYPQEELDLEIDDEPDDKEEDKAKKKKVRVFKMGAEAALKKGRFEDFDICCPFCGKSVDRKEYSHFYSFSCSDGRDLYSSCHFSMRFFKPNFACNFRFHRIPTILDTM